MPQPKRNKEPRARARKLQSADRPLFAAAMVLATLALLPTVFTRTTVENFEFPKTELPTQDSDLTVPRCAVRY